MLTSIKIKKLLKSLKVKLCYLKLHTLQISCLVSMTDLQLFCVNKDMNANFLTIIIFF